MKHRPVKSYAAITFLSIVLFSACSSGGGTGSDDDNGNGNSNGNTTSPEPTFTNVQNIFNGSCGGAGCHIGERESGVRLDGYNNVMESVGTQYGIEIVQPGDPDGSPLVDKIEANPDRGVRMPNGGSPLSDDQISLIRTWIDEGAQNN